MDDTTTGTTGALLRGGPPEPESLARFLARPLRVLVATPVRQFQVLGVLTLAATVWAAFAWIVVPTDPFGPSATDEVVGTLAGLVEGTVEERWVARYFLLALGAAVVACSALAVWGAVLGVHSIVVAGRLNRAGQRFDTDDSHVPPTLAFWGTLVLGMLTRNVARLTALVGWTLPGGWGVLDPALTLWWSVTFATVLATLWRLVQRRRWHRARERRRAEGRVRAAERRAAAKEARRLGRER